MFQGYDPQRIGIMAEFINEFIRLHNKNQKGAEFKIGDKVLYNNPDVVDKPIICEILAVNVQEKDAVEYAITNVYGQLVWEDELKAIT